MHDHCLTTLLAKLCIAPPYSISPSNENFSHSHVRSSMDIHAVTQCALNPDIGNWQDL